MKKISELWKKHKSEIIVGVIVTFICNIISSVKNWIVNESPKIGVTFLESVLNAIYCAAATYTADTAFKSLLTMIIGLLLGFMAVITISSITKENKIVGFLSKNISKVKTADKKSSRETLRFKIGVIFAFIIYAVMLLFGCLVITTPSTIYNKFERDLTMIAPYVENQQILELKSDWVLMKSWEDYQEIYEIIDEVKKTNDLLGR